MSLTIKTNTSSLIAQSSLKTSSSKLNQAIERMSSGAKINHAKDNAANYSIATNYSTKLSALQVAEDNCAMGLDLVTTAEESLKLIQDKLQRLRDLQEQASNGTYGKNSLKAINSEVNALVDEIERIYNTTEYNGIKLFGDNTAGGTATATLTTLITTGIASFSTVQTRATVTVDESKRVSNVTSFTSGETYYLTTSDDLVALQDLVVAGSSTDNVTFEQVADIDMDGIAFEGIASFEGNYNGHEYKISNLKIDNSSVYTYTGLFGSLCGAVQNIILKNCDISGNGYNTGGITGYLYSGGTISNCSVSGKVSGSSYVGGLAGRVNFCCKIENCNVNAEVVGNDYVGGLCGYVYFESDLEIDNVSVTGTVTGNSNVGGLIGMAGDAYLSDSSVACKVNCADSTTAGAIYGRTASDDKCTFTNVTYDATLNSGISLIGKNNDGSDVSDIIGSSTIAPTPDPAPAPNPEPTPTPSDLQITYAPDSILLQIGIGGNWDSQITISTKFELTGLEDLCDIGLDSTTDFLTKIDSMLNIISEKQTEFGSVSNRLESALDSISVSYDNLASSRSTIMDADIAEVSSEYIKMQILQEASATLMATANQSPAIALQLI